MIIFLLAMLFYLKVLNEFIWNILSFCKVGTANGLILDFELVGSENSGIENRHVSYCY